MEEYLKKRQVIEILTDRSQALRGIHGDIGGACSGAASLIDKCLPTYRFAEEVEYMVYEWENRHCDFLGWVGSYALRSFLKMVKEIHCE